MGGWRNNFSNTEISASAGPGKWGREVEYLGGGGRGGTGGGEGGREGKGEGEGGTPVSCDRWCFSRMLVGLAVKVYNSIVTIRSLETLVFTRIADDARC